MPTTYTHDLYGKKVFRSLCAEMKNVIREHGDLFRIGLHGPDIFFYHMLNGRVRNTGVRMHHEKAGSFFEKGMERVRMHRDKALLSYLLGFGCHYLLDSACHPFINEKAGEGVISHTLLEKEFDRMLMLEEKKDPYHFYPSDCIVPKLTYACVIHRAVPEITPGQIMTSLRMQKFITNAMVYDNHGRRVQAIRLLSRLGGKKLSREVTEYFMAKDPVPGSEAPARELKELFEGAVCAGGKELKELYELSKEPKTLSDRWNRTYIG